MRESVTYWELVAESEAKGAERQSRKIATNMLRAGMDPQEVAAILELTPEQVQRIQAEISP